MSTSEPQAYIRYMLRNKTTGHYATQGNRYPGWTDRIDWAGRWSTLGQMKSHLTGVRKDLSRKGWYSDRAAAYLAEAEVVEVLVTLTPICKYAVSAEGIMADMPVEVNDATA